MNVKMAAQEIRERVTMEQIISLYGYKAKHNFMCCPFHGEKEPSLKIYPKTGGWHCYGCGRGGSVIDFVMEHEGCDFRTAVYAIDNVMHLGLMDPREDPEEARKQQQIQNALDHFVLEANRYCDVKIKLIEWSRDLMLRRVKDIEAKRDKDVQSVTADEWTFLLAYQSEDEYRQYMVDKIKELKEVVAEWRRKARRAI